VERDAPAEGSAPGVMSVESVELFRVAPGGGGKIGAGGSPPGRMSVDAADASGTDDAPMVGESIPGGSRLLLVTSVVASGSAPAPGGTTRRSFGEPVGGAIEAEPGESPGNTRRAASGEG
jgi:hypothetical protein